MPLPPGVVEELGGVLETRNAEAAAREERLDRVDTVIEGTAGPTDDPAEWEALVEEHYAVVVPQMAELDPAERIGAEDDYVRSLGHLPKPLMRSLRAGMLSGEADQEAAAALRIKTLADHDPALIEAIPEAERARAQAIAEFAELGLKPERAVELGDERLQETWPRRPGESEDGGGDETDGDSRPAGRAPADGDDAEEKKTADASKADESEEDEPKEEGDKGELDGLPPTVSLFQGRTATIRDDRIGEGHYWADRTDKNNKKYHHTGVDLNATPGEPVAFPVDGTVEMIGDPYGDQQFKSIWIKTESGHRIGMLYITPHDGDGKQLVKPGDKVKAGDVIGSVQDITARYPRMNNHVHFEVRKGMGRGEPIDPTPWLRSSGVIE